jgi:hypothetical protein
MVPNSAMAGSQVWKNFSSRNPLPEQVWKKTLVPEIRCQSKFGKNYSSRNPLPEQVLNKIIRTF